MGFSRDYPDIPDYEYKENGYQTSEMIRYQSNIFLADFWARSL